MVTKYYKNITISWKIIGHLHNSRK